MAKQPPVKKKNLTIEQAQELMRRSQEKKDIANTQYKIGQAQINNKVKPGSMGAIGSGVGVGKNITRIPVGQERIDIARKLRLEASNDSLKAVSSYPELTPKRVNKLTKTYKTYKNK